MVHRTGTVYPCGSNVGFGLRFCAGSLVWHETLEEGQGTCRLKQCDYNNKDEVNSLNILSNNIIIIKITFDCIEKIKSSYLKFRRKLFLY